jgi:hypothetical protein
MEIPPDTYLDLAAAQFFNFDVDLPERCCQRLGFLAGQFAGDLQQPLAGLIAGTENGVQRDRATQQVEIYQRLHISHHRAASVGRYPLRCDGEQLFIIAAGRRLLDVGVYLVLPDARVTHGLNGAAQDGTRVVLGKKPDFDVWKFLIYAAVARLRYSASRVAPLVRLRQ